MYRQWWRHQMDTFSALLAICAGNSPVPGEFPSQRPVIRSFDVFFDLRLNKRLSKQSWGWWFETLSHPLWRHCNVIRIFLVQCNWYTTLVSYFDQHLCLFGHQAIFWRVYLRSRNWFRSWTNAAWHVSSLDPKWWCKRVWIFVDDLTLSDMNSLLISDAIWRQRYWSTMAQIMSCCLSAPSHYLNQWWLEITCIHSSAISPEMRYIWPLHMLANINISNQIFKDCYMHLSGDNELMSPWSAHKEISQGIENANPRVLDCCRGTERLFHSPHQSSRMDIGHVWRFLQMPDIG